MRQVDLETSAGTIRVELDDEKAPETVKNFLTNVENGHYDGTVFHRVIKGFMIQGGDPTGTGAGTAGFELPDEVWEDAAHDRAGSSAQPTADRTPTARSSS